MICTHRDKATARCSRLQHALPLAAGGHTTPDTPTPQAHEHSPHTRPGANRARAALSTNLETALRAPQHEHMCSTPVADVKRRACVLAAHGLATLHACLGPAPGGRTRAAAASVCVRPCGCHGKSRRPPCARAVAAVARERGHTMTSAMCVANTLVWRCVPHLAPTRVHHDNWGTRPKRSYTAMGLATTVGRERATLSHPPSLHVIVCRNTASPQHTLRRGDTSDSGGTRLKHQRHMPAV